MAGPLGRLRVGAAQRRSNLKVGEGKVGPGGPRARVAARWSGLLPRAIPGPLPTASWEPRAFPAERATATGSKRTCAKWGLAGARVLAGRILARGRDDGG